MDDLSLAFNLGVLSQTHDYDESKRLEEFFKEKLSKEWVDNTEVYSNVAGKNVSLLEAALLEELVRTDYSFKVLYILLEVKPRITKFFFQTMLEDSATTESVLEILPEESLQEFKGLINDPDVYKHMFRLNYKYFQEKFMIEALVEKFGLNPNMTINGKDVIQFIDEEKRQYPDISKFHDFRVAREEIKEYLIGKLGSTPEEPPKEESSVPAVAAQDVTLNQSEMIQDFLDPKVTDPNFLEKLSHITPEITAERPPNQCLRGDLITQLSPEDPLNGKGIVATKTFVSPYEFHQIDHLIWLDWVADTIALALGRGTGVRHDSSDFTFEEDYYRYQQHQISGQHDVPELNFVDNSGDLYEETSQDIVFGPSFLSELVSKFEGRVSESESELIKSLQFVGRKIPSLFRGFPKLKRQIMAYVVKTDDDRYGEDKNTYQVWVVCDNSFAQYDSMVVVDYQDSFHSAGHAYLADLRGGNVKMWDPNLNGLQKVTDKYAKEHGCEDEMKDQGWCQTFTLFYLEESYLNQSQFHSDMIKKLVQGWMFNIKVRTANFDESEIKAEFVSKFGSEDNPWCAFVNFVRKLATRYQHLQHDVSSLHKPSSGGGTEGKFASVSKKVIH